MAAADAHAQVVRGLLADAETGEPIVGGELTLLTTADSAVARTLADERGEFVLRAPSEGQFRLAGDRIGYGAASGPIALEEGMVIEVVFRLSVRAVLLEPITVEATRRITPGSILHAERRERGLGVFLSAEDVLAKTELDVRDALREVEGMRVRPGRNCGLGRGRGSGIPLWDGNCLISTEGWGCMVIVVNELPLPVVGFDLVEILPQPYQISAVEVYRTYQEVPDELERWAWTGERPCGVVAIWTHAAW
jgi:hypothetical protein